MPTAECESVHESSHQDAEANVRWRYIWTARKPDLAPSTVVAAQADVN
jgi:hypothetical protein